MLNIAGRQSVTTRTRLKFVLRRIIPTRLPPIIVASMGRSGSTLVYDAVCNALTEARFPKFLKVPGNRIVSDTAWDLASKGFVPGVAYKTHGLAHELPDDSGARIVFLFGSATDAALSVVSCQERYGDQWIADHFAHLRASGSFEELGTRDVLRFEEQLDGWIGKAGTHRMILHYDALWDHENDLSEFTGVRLHLPSRRPRNGAASVHPKIRTRFGETYSELDARIEALPPCQILD